MYKAVLCRSVWKEFATRDDFSIATILGDLKSPFGRIPADFGGKFVAARGIPPPTGKGTRPQKACFGGSNRSREDF